MVAFIKGWLLTLVMLSVIPFLVAAGAFMTIFISRMATKGQTAYAKAAIVVEQTIGSIRTVSSNHSFFVRLSLCLREYLVGWKTFS